jgi:molybdate transport system substrate-binding protein
MRLRILVPVLAAACLVSSACAATPKTPITRTLTVFAAASLTDAFTEIGEAFEASRPGDRVVFSFAGSQNLRTQIEQGAGADVFASANATEIDTLIDGGLVQEGAPEPFVTNQLVVVMPAGNPAGIASLADLAEPGVKIVLAAEEVPAGKYARQVLDNLNATLGTDYKDRVLANVVSNDTDIRQVLARVQLGEADAGIVYVSDTVAAPGLRKLEFPADANAVAQYPIAPLAQSSDPELATAFIDFVLSPEGQAILEKWGFMPVAP